MNNLDTIRQEVNYEMPEGRGPGPIDVERNMNNLQHTLSVWKENSNAVNDYKQIDNNSIIVDINLGSELEGEFDRHVLNLFTSLSANEYPDSFQGDRVTQILV